MIATGLSFVFGFCLALLLALLLSPLVWRRSRRMARREFEATIPASANEIRASYDHVRAAAALETRTREMEARSLMERAARERADAGRMSRENADLRIRNDALIALLSEHKTAFQDVAETLESREAEFDRMEGDLRESRHELDLRSVELDALARRFRVLVERAEKGGVDTGFDPDDIAGEEEERGEGGRRSRVEMQSTLDHQVAEIETLQTELRQAQSTVRERDATILGLLTEVAGTGPGVADRQAGTPMERATTDVSSTRRTDRPEEDGTVREKASAVDAAKSFIGSAWRSALPLLAIVSTRTSGSKETTGNDDPGRHGSAAPDRSDRRDQTITAEPRQRGESAEGRASISAPDDAAGLADASQPVRGVAAAPAWSGARDDASAGTPAEASDNPPTSERVIDRADGPVEHSGAPTLETQEAAAETTSDPRDMAPRDTGARAPNTAVPDPDAVAPKEERSDTIVEGSATPMPTPPQQALPAPADTNPDPAAGLSQDVANVALERTRGPKSIATRVREELNLPSDPLGTDDADDETLRERIGALAARVIDVTARIEGSASPIESILAVERPLSSTLRPRERQTLADRVWFARKNG